MIDVSNVSETSILGYYEARRDAWRSFTAEYLPDADLVGVTPHYSDLRTFRDGDMLIKVARTCGLPDARSSDLLNEYEVLERLASGRDNSAPKYRTPATGWVILEAPWKQGQSLATLLVDGRGGSVRLRSVARSLASVNGLGIAHRDVSPENILCASDSIALIDFGRSQITSRANAFASDFLGRGKAKGVTSFRFVMRAIMLQRRKGRGRILRKLYLMKLRKETKRGKVMEALIVKDHAAQGQLMGLAELELAWESVFTKQDLEQRSNEPRALDGRTYSVSKGPYSFEIAGYVLQGDVSWELVWETVWSRIPLRGKRVVEYTEGLGLASTFACLDGAASAVLINNSSDFSGPALVAKAFGVGNVEQHVAASIADNSGVEGDIAFISDPTWLEPALPEMIRNLDGFSTLVIRLSQDWPEDALVRSLRSIGFKELEFIALSNGKARFVLAQSRAVA